MRVAELLPRLRVQRLLLGQEPAAQHTVLIAPHRQLAALHPSRAVVHRMLRLGAVLLDVHRPVDLSPARWARAFRCHFVSPLDGGRPGAGRPHTRCKPGGSPRPGLRGTSTRSPSGPAAPPAARPGRRRGGTWTVRRDRRQTGGGPGASTVPADRTAAGWFQTTVPAPGGGGGPRGR